MPVCRVVEAQARKGRTPLRKQLDQPARCQMVGYLIVRHPRNTDPGKRRLNHQIDIAKRHWTIDVDAGGLAAMFKVPAVERAAFEPEADATMLRQIVRRFGRLVAR